MSEITKAIGAKQTQISQLTRGSAKYMGRFTSVSTFSNFFTPPLAGLVWDLAGLAKNCRQ